MYDVKILIGQAIKKHRQKRGLTQEKLAETLGITPAHLRHMEAGRRTPSVDILYKAARELNMSIDSLFFPENMKTIEMRSEIIRKLNDRTPHELSIIYSAIEAMENKDDE